MGASDAESSSARSRSAEVDRLRAGADEARRGGDLDAAAELLGQAALLRPGSSQLHQELGILLRQAGRIEAARVALARADATASSVSDQQAARAELATLPPEPPGRDNFRVGQVLACRRSSAGGGLVEYTVREVHGGAFGAVYVVDEGSKRRAIKTLDAGYLWSDDDRRRFLREAATWISLDPHPNVVSAHTVDEIEGFPALVMDYVPGGDLARRLREGPMDLREALERGMELCAGMTHAWRQLGLVHRDLKPANCLLDAGGTLKVADFGLSRVLRGARESALGLPLATPAARALYTTVAGTPAYMAPEQFDVLAELDTRADIYAFGVILYQMLTGELLTPGAAAADLAVRGHRSPVPDQLRRVIRGCVSPNRRHRPASFVEVRQQLATAYADLMGRLAPSAPPAQPIRTWTWVERGIGFWRLGLHAEALAAIDRGLADVDADTEDRAIAALWHIQGQTLAALGRAEESISSYDRALRHTPTEPSTWLCRGNSLSHLKRYDECLHDYDQALALAPNHPMVLTAKATTLGQLDRFVEADELFRRAWEVQPRNVVLLINWAAILCLAGQLDEALQRVDAALEITPRNAYGLTHRGRILWNQGRYQDALACYDRVLEIEPNEVSALQQRVDCLSALGRRHQALAACEQLLARHPGNEFAMRRSHELASNA